MTSNWEHTLLGPVAALGERVLAILPNVLAMMILLLVGLGVAWGMGHLMERLLRVIGLDRLCDRIGIAGALLRGGIKADPSYIIGHITYWLIVIFATTASLGALDVVVYSPFGHSGRDRAHRLSRLEFCVAGRPHRRRECGVASGPMDRSRNTLGHSAPDGGHGARTVRDCPAHRRRWIRHYLGRPRPRRCTGAGVGW